MKILLKLITISSLFLFVYIMPDKPVTAQILKAILITDESGMKEKISDPSFSYSDDKCYVDQYIEIISLEPTRKGI